MEEKKCACDKTDETALDRKGILLVLIRLGVSLSLALLGYFLFNEARYGVIVNFVVMFAAWLVSSYDIVYHAFRNLIKEKNPFDENMLMTIASLGAFALRFFGEGHNEFLEAVMVVFLYQIGELFEDIATAKSHKAITEAVGLRAKSATKLVKGQEVIVSPESLQIGDEILVKVGEIVPADGTISAGAGSLDMSSLTGEFLPIDKKVGDFVNSGTLLKSGSLTLHVDKAYADSTVAKIISLVENSSKSKSHADKFITRFSRIYTPTVVGISALVAVLPPLILGANDGTIWFRWLYTAICLLVISCPCAIVISVPLAYFSGIGLASKHGIVIKGAAYFDKLNELGVLVSDKTGTLTYGDFRVSKLVNEKISEAEFSRYLHAAESRSNHPLAKAIMKGSDPSDFLTSISVYEEIGGKGTHCVYQGHEIYAGSKALFLDQGFILPDVNENGSVIFLSVDGVYCGYVVLNDVVRKESADLVKGLKKLGVKTVMLTGDKAMSAQSVAHTLGIEECHSELLPEEKTKLLKDKIDANAKTVAFIGDGINDAASIILADVGVAMGGIGSDMAIDSADVVIMNDDPSKVVTALKIARATRRRAIWDIVIALSVKLAVMLCAIFIPTMPLLIAVLADTGLTMVLVIFSLLLLYKKIR
jgi:Cd2+/Zn2+-exporting ATPase